MKTQLCLFMVSSLLTLSLFAQGEGEKRDESIVKIMGAYEVDGKYILLTIPKVREKFVNIKLNNLNESLNFPYQVLYGNKGNFQILNAVFANSQGFSNGGKFEISVVDDRVKSGSALITLAPGETTSFDRDEIKLKCSDEEISIKKVSSTSIQDLEALINSKTVPLLPIQENIKPWKILKFKTKDAYFYIEDSLGNKKTAYVGIPGNMKKYGVILTETLLDGGTQRIVLQDGPVLSIPPQNRSTDKTAIWGNEYDEHHEKDSELEVLKLEDFDLKKLELPGVPREKVVFTTPCDAILDKKPVIECDESDLAKKIIEKLETKPE